MPASSPQRTRGAIAVIVAVMLLFVVVASRNGEDQAEAPVDQKPSDTEPTPLPTITATPNPFAVATTDGILTISRLSSPSPNVARAQGSLTVAEVTAEVTANGVAVDNLQITAQPDGSFEVDIFGLTPGPQVVCIADACQRVLVADPATESAQVIEARIAEAIRIATTRFDFDRYLPGWTIEIAGQNSATGGTASVRTKQLFINRNSGRTLDEYVITVLHEIAHAIDADYLDDADRDQFRSSRGHAAELPWGPDGAVMLGGNRWSNSAEDFAEVFVAWAFDGDYSIESTIVAPQPTPADLVAFCKLIALPDMAC